MTSILISFCNPKNLLNLTALGKPPLGLLDLETLTCKILRFPIKLGLTHGVTGLTASDRFVYLVTQAPRCVLLVCDRLRFTLVSRYIFTLGRDIHSIRLVDDILYAVSTGTDEVIAMPCRGEEVGPERVIWRPPADARREDLHHLNSIVDHQGDLLVSGFDKKAGNKWETVLEGFIYNISKDEVVCRGIKQPHSLFLLDEKIGFCESRSSIVRMLDDSRTQILPGYSRGVCRSGEHLFVATSARRNVPVPAANVVDDYRLHQPQQSRCTVNLLSPADFRIQESIDLGTFASEIYDLLPIADASNWPIVKKLR